MIKKKILVYAHYYFPDVASTGQILKDLAEGMVDKFDVTVICTVPSYTGSISSAYKEKKFYTELINGVKVIRVPVPRFVKSSKVSRIKNIIAYFFRARKATNMLVEQDYVLAISQPPILGGMLGVYGRKKLNAKLIYNIQDFNPEQIEAIGYIKNKLFINFARWLDTRTCRASALVITVGRDLADTLKKRFKKHKLPSYTIINNWINEEEIYPLSADNYGVLEFKRRYGLENKFIIMYSGNIGLYYDLEGLMEVIRNFQNTMTPDGHEVVFVFVGTGSILNKLVKFKEENSLNNVVFIPYQDKEKLIFSLNAANVHWCVNAKGIKGVSCPSKFYGIIAVGKPVLGVLEKDSEIEILIRETGCGICSLPGDYKSIAENIRWFIDHDSSDEISIMGKNGYEFFINKMTKRMSIERYIKVIDELT